MSPNIPAVEHANEAPESPFDDAELVIYTAEPKDGYEPQTDWGDQLGLVSYSLWARWEDEGTEIPLYHKSETGAWFSLDTESFEPAPGEPVSDAFVEAICNMVDEDVGDGWGDPTEAVWDAMRDVEKAIWQSLKWAFLSMEADEAALVIDWCTKRGGDE